MTPPLARGFASRIPARQAWASLLTIGWLLAFTWSSMPTGSAAPAPGQGLPFGATGQTDEVPQRNPAREGSVYDTVGILTARQEDSIQNDLDRASWLGVEILVYTRMSDDSAEESQAFADALLAQWSVESEEGANDGLVYLISVNPADPQSNSIVISSGHEALPIRQLDATTLRDMLETEMAPAVDEGEFNTAIQYGVRRVLNYREYTPTDVAPLTGLQQTLNTAAAIMAAGLVQLAVFGYFVIPIVRERRITLAPSSGSLAVYAVALSFASIATGIVAIAGRNGWGSLTALGLLIVGACVIPLAIGIRRRRTGRTREIPVRRRTPIATNATIGRAHG